MFSFDSNPIIRRILITRENKVRNEDSARNWKISSPLPEPTTFLRLISLARLADLAVARFI
jgi:hypothetical protein